MACFNTLCVNILDVMTSGLNVVAAAQQLQQREKSYSLFGRVLSVKIEVSIKQVTFSPVSAVEWHLISICRDCLNDYFIAILHDCDGKLAKLRSSCFELAKLRNAKLRITRFLKKYYVIRIG